MFDIDTISTEKDDERLRQKFQDEMGLTDEEWWLKTDPDNPPLKAGDKVWIESFNGVVADKETVRMIREVQTVESVMPIPCSDAPLWSIELVGIPYMFSQYNLRKA